MNKILKLSKDEYESLIKREKIIGEASSESIIYDLNNGYILKDLMDESLFYFKSKEEMMYTEDQLLRFSDIDVDSFYFTKKIIYVDEVLRACIMKKCNGYVVNYIDPLSINLNSIIKAIDKFTKDTNIISKMNILGYDMQSNFMYDGNKFGAIDTIHYNFSDMDEDKIFSKNIFSFNDEIAKFLVEIYFKKFINEDITLNNMYESIKQNEIEDLNSFIKLFIKKLSEYCNKQIVYLKDATNAIRENDNLLYPYCPIYSLKR